MKFAGVFAVLVVVPVIAAQLPRGMVGHGEVVAESGETVGVFTLVPFAASPERSFPYSIDLAWRDEAAHLPDWKANRPRALTAAAPLPAIRFDPPASPVLPPLDLAGYAEGQTRLIGSLAPLMPITFSQNAGPDGPVVSWSVYLI
ncbi:MAG: hypothetical protein B7X11_03720, partial [Acidobacteria bacterium 37-65-4]